MRLLAPAAAILLFLARSSSAANTDFEFIKVSGGPWFTSGMGRWQTSFPLQQGRPKGEFGFGSTLEFQDPSDLVWLWSVEVRPIRRLSVEFQYADSSSVGGQSRDHDWLDAPNSQVTVFPSGNVYVRPQQQDMSLSQSSLSGRTTYVSANAYARVLQYEHSDPEDWIVHQYLDFLLGYSWYDDRYRMKNLVQLVSTGDIINTPPPGPIAGQDSTFHFHWEGFKLGVREDTGILEHLRAIGIFSYSPFISYHGDSFWNLRTDLSPTPPSFTQDASADLFEGKLSVIYSPVSWFAAEAGYMLIYFHTHPGGHMIFDHADGSTTTQDLDSAWSERKGFLLNLALKF